MSGIGAVGRPQSLIVKRRDCHEGLVAGIAVALGFNESMVATISGGVLSVVSVVLMALMGVKKAKGTKQTAPTPEQPDADDQESDGLG